MDGELIVAGHAASGVTAIAEALDAELRGVARVRGAVDDAGEVARGARAGVPVLLVVHDPSDVLVTLLATEPHLSPGRTLAGWIRYHRHALASADITGVVVATYEQACLDLPAVLARVLPGHEAAAGGAVAGAHDRVVAVAGSGAAALHRDARVSWALGVVGRPSLHAKRVAADALWLRARHLAGITGPDLGRAAPPRRRPG